MTPTEIVRDAFERTVTPWMEGLGFKYSRSQFQYRRKAVDFEQLISIFVDRKSSAALIYFSSSFGVKSRKYNRWLKAQGRDRTDRYVFGCADWNIPGWRRGTDQFLGFDFTDPSQRPAVLEEWRRRCEAAGMPYLERLSSSEGAANELLRLGYGYEDAADLLMFAGLTRRAIEALQLEIESLERQDFSWTEKSHPTLIAKKKRQALERYSKRTTIQERIRRLLNSESGSRAGFPAQPPP